MNVQWLGRKYRPNFWGEKKKGEGDNRGAEEMPMRHEGSCKTYRLKERLKSPMVKCR